MSCVVASYALLSSSSPLAHVTQLLVKKPEERLPLTDVLRHPWIIENAEPSGIPLPEAEGTV